MRQTATNSLTLLPSAICCLFLILLACVPAAVAQTAPSTGMEGDDDVGSDQFADRMKAPTGIAQDGSARAG